ncbi:hypothetical protein PshuTeo2_05410 [Pseudomonas hunanensis]|uniref:hypothetical protein n=1 Tax=Pseudomonas hunanensis TaxID=1247546 RepID=UPI002AA0AD29|nr:hypothetical protein [Pseudomonas hunanensis]MDY7070519.1 hypothetical protein [Pseudomonas hunanensis]
MIRFFWGRNSFYRNILKRYEEGHVAADDVRKKFHFSEKKMNNLMAKAVSEYNAKHSEKIFSDD